LHGLKKEDLANILSSESLNKIHTADPTERDPLTGLPTTDISSPEYYINFGVQNPILKFFVPQKITDNSFK
jgi:hypothetical protein